MLYIDSRRFRFDSGFPPQQKLGFPFPFFPPRDLAFSPTDLVFPLEIRLSRFRPWLRSGFGEKTWGFPGKERLPKTRSQGEKTESVGEKAKSLGGKKGKGKPNFCFPLTLTKEENRFPVQEERPAKLDKRTEFKKAELCFSLAAAGCELAPWLAC